MIKAEYIDHMGDDLRVANAARVSFNKESFYEADGLLGMPDIKLISYLAAHGHFTPFTHPQITIRETLPIFVARQRFKHTVGFSYNEVSRRYVDDTPEFYIPDVWRSRPDDGKTKQGSAGEHVKSAYMKKLYADHIEEVTLLYTKMIEAGIAPEQARMVLPQSMLTSYYVTGSLAAFARAYKLRVDAHAQLEIQGLGQQWGKVIEPLFPYSWKALTR